MAEYANVRPSEAAGLTGLAAFWLDAAVALEAGEARAQEHAAAMKQARRR